MSTGSHAARGTTAIPLSVLPSTFSSAQVQSWPSRHYTGNHKPAAPASLWTAAPVAFHILMKVVISLLALLGFGVTLLSVYLSVWTSAKDFRDDCRNQNNSLMCSYQAVSKN